MMELQAASASAALHSDGKPSVARRPGDVEDPSELTRNTERRFSRATTVLMASAVLFVTAVVFFVAVRWVVTELPSRHELSTAAQSRRGDQDGKEIQLENQGNLIIR